MSSAGSYGNYGGSPYACKHACSNCRLCENDLRTYNWCLADCWKCRVCKFRNAEDFPPYYPPVKPLFWRPHYYMYPRSCYNTCGYKTCDEFHDRLNKYQDCLDRDSVYTCRQRWGCNNPKGFSYQNTPPLNPLYTGCVPCWKNGFITF
jgi:hypothetical protein